ncbi:MAG: hypothetical protein JHD35_24940 [Sphingopyxis sp.]|nr:hypothetical protein [Sphingopyxis sp.]
MLRRVFGKRQSVPIGSLGADSETETETVSLSMDDIARYVKAAVRRRGYPDDSFDMIARRVCFLERRGLPGFSALIREIILNAHETMDERIGVKRPNGFEGGRCPIMESVMLNEHLPRFAALPEGKVQATPAPSNPVLILPKLAGYAGPHGVVFIMIYSRDGEETARSFVDGFRVAHYGSTDALFESDTIGYAACPDEWLDDVNLRAGYVDRVDVTARLVSRLSAFIEDGR